MSSISSVKLVSPVLQASAISPAASPAAPQLGIALRADFEALQNDFEQASELAADFQRQLSGKSNEFADLKHLFEKTTRDLTRLQHDIEELREERHRLANEAMRAEGLQFQLGQMSLERDEFKNSAFAQQSVVAALEAHVAQLTAELEWTRQNSPISSSQTPPIPADPSIGATLQALVVSVDRLREMIEQPPSNKPAVKPTVVRPKSPTPAPNSEPEFIDISFTA